MKNWSVSTKVTVALLALLVVSLVYRSANLGRMARQISHQTATPAAVEAARKLIVKNRLARVFKDRTNHAKFAAIRCAQVFAVDWTTVEVEDHHLPLAQAAAGAMVEFLSDLELPVRAVAADALGRMGKPAARPLIDVALTSPDKDVRSNATRALVAIGEPAVPEMIQAVKGGKPTQKVGAALALGELGATRAIGALIGALGAKETDVRLTCRDALVTLGEASVEPLIGALTNASPFTRRHAAEALGELGDARAAAPLLALFEDPNRQVRLAAVYAVGKVHDPQAVVPLIALLSNDDRELREGAAVSLGQLDDDRATTPLITTLDDPIEAVREQAAAALGRLRPTDPAALAAIAARTWSVNEGTRLAAVFALGQIGSPSSAPAILANLDPATEPSVKVRRRAARALGKIGSPAAIPWLVAAFADPDWRVNYAAVAALGEIGAPAIAPLVAQMGSADALLARYARMALLSMKPVPEAAFTQALRLPAAEARLNAAAALGVIGGSAATGLLQTVYRSDPDERVRFAAGQALGLVHGGGDPAAALPEGTDLDEPARPADGVETPPAAAETAPEPSAEGN